MGLDTVELVMAVEEEFEIVIPNAAAANLVTVGDLTDWVTGQLRDEGRASPRPEVRARIVAIVGRFVSVTRPLEDQHSFVDDLGMA